MIKMRVVETTRIFAHQIGIYRAVGKRNVSAQRADSAAVRRKRLLLEEKLSAKLTDVV